MLAARNTRGAPRSVITLKRVVSSVVCFTPRRFGALLCAGLLGCVSGSSLAYAEEVPVVSAVPSATLEPSPPADAELTDEVADESAPEPGEDQPPLQHLTLTPGVDVVAGTHTSAANFTIALDGLYEIPSQRVRGFQAGFVTASVFGAHAEQWGWPYQGLQIDLAALGLIGHRALSVGGGVHVYYNRSWKQLRGGAATGIDDLSVMDQRVGHVFIQSQFGGADKRKNTLRLTVRNDVWMPAALLFGDGGDSFRTGDVELAFHRVRGIYLFSFATGLSLRTGLVDHDSTHPTDPRYVDPRGQPWASYSQGLIYGRFNFAFLIPHRNGGSELAFGLGLGYDSDAVREGVQNGFHDLIGDKRIPPVEGDDSFMIELSLAYRFAFNLAAPPGQRMMGTHVPSPARTLIAGQRP